MISNDKILSEVDIFEPLYTMNMNFPLYATELKWPYYVVRLHKRPLKSTDHEF